MQLRFSPAGPAAALCSRQQAPAASASPVATPSARAACAPTIDPPTRRWTSVSSASPGRGQHNAETHPLLLALPQAHCCLSHWSVECCDTWRRTYFQCPAPCPADLACETTPSTRVDRETLQYPVQSKQIRCKFRGSPALNLDIKDTILRRSPSGSVHNI